MSSKFENYLGKFMNNGDEDDNNDQLTNTLNDLISNCTYHDMDNLPTHMIHNKSYQYTAIHINIHSLPSKHFQI